MTAALDHVAPVRPQAAPLLMPLERRILLHLAHEYTRGRIRAAEGITEGVLDIRSNRIYGLLGARSHAHAVARGHELGLLPREGFGRPFLDADDLALLRWIAAGLRNQDIADLVGDRVKAIGHATRVLYRHMLVRNRPQAVHVGFCTGLLEIDVLREMTDGN